MLFHTFDYALFLALVVFGFWALAKRPTVRMLLVFLASCAFYMAWKPEYILLILGSSLLDHVAGHRIFAASDPKVKKAWLSLSLAGNLGLLFSFKYYNFFALQTAARLGDFGIEVEPALLEAALPVGISFYTFQTLSYSIDIYRGKLEPTGWLPFAAFVTYFPQLVAGPIVRASELLPQLQARPKLDREMASRGLFLILVGLVKKLALGDYLALNMADRIFEQPELYTATEVVVGLYAFTMQLYLDFSGYTDVARGSAMLMGLELPHNFDRPYRGTSPADFWRRWHQTLSRWLRDYLYFPLGGSRVGEARAYFNLGLTMFLVGIWHGWWRNFEVFFWYASLQAAAMMTHRFFYKKSGRKKGDVDSLQVQALKIFANMQFVVFSRILFRATSMENAGDVAGRLFSGTTSMQQVSVGVWLVLIFSFVAHYTPKRLFESFERFFVSMPAPAQGLVIGVVAALLSLVAATQAVPYIYFQF